MRLPFAQYTTDMLGSCKKYPRNRQENYELKFISFDIFQTLVDVNERIPQIWQGILKDAYTPEKAAEGAGTVLGELPRVYGAAVLSDRFRTMEEVYLECAEAAAGKLSFRASPRDIAYHLMAQHAQAPFYPEVPECLRRLSSQYKIVLSSDSNHLMVDGLLERVPHDRAFISDDLGCYKGSREGRFFRTVLRELNTAPEEVLHIGDSRSDIHGARQAGIASCLVLRDGKSWSGACEADCPDYVISNLQEVEDILKGRKGP